MHIRKGRRERLGALQKRMPGYKNLYTKLERLSQLQWLGSFVNRHIMTLQKKTKHRQHRGAPSPLPDRQVPVICTGFRSLSSVMHLHYEDKKESFF